MFAQVQAPRLVVLPTVQKIGFYVTLSNVKTEETQMIEVWAYSGGFADVMREIDFVRGELGLSKSVWKFEESWEIDAPF